MASSQDTQLDNLIINEVASESTLEDMVADDQIQPNQFYMTPDEDMTKDFIAMPIGTIFPSAIPQTSSAFHLLDGSTISKTGIYADFATLLQSLVTAGYNISCTQAQFDSDVATYGQCGKFVIDTDTIRLPRITKFIEGLSSITNIGTSFQAGLPNITGNANTERLHNGATFSGAFAKNSYNGQTSGGSGSSNQGFDFDASRSNPIYGRSNTVQPQSTAYPYYIVLANSYKTPVQVDIDEIVTDLNDKLGKSDVVRYPISKYISSDGKTWYTIYSDGWKECGGALGSAGSFANRTTVMPVTFSTASDYNLVLTASWGDSSGRGACIISKSASQFVSNTTNNGNTATYYACGY